MQNYQSFQANCETLPIMYKRGRKAYNKIKSKCQKDKDHENINYHLLNLYYFLINENPFYPNS